MDKEKAKEHYRKRVALRLLEWREEKGVSQEDVAEVLGLGQSAYCKIEKGETGLTAEYAFKLADYFGKSVDELLRIEHPVLNMHDHSSNGYNVVLTQNQNGMSDEQFKLLYSAVSDQTNAVKGMMEQLTLLVDRLTMNKE